MTLDDLLQFINEEDAYLIEKQISVDLEKQILARTVKLSEEVGELADAVLAYLNDQRKEKIYQFKKKHLENEWADVLIVLLLIAKSADVNIQSALSRKIKTIIKRRPPYGTKKQKS